MLGFIKKYPFVFLFLLALVVRIPSFFCSVIDHDESTYLIISKLLFEGKKMYHDVWENKPVGMYIFTGILNYLSFEIIPFFRLLLTVLVALSGYFLFKAKLLISKKIEKSILVGALYVVCMSLYRYGLHGSTELFFNFFTTLFFYLLLLNLSKKYSYYILLGLIMGFGFIIKYVVIIDFFIILLFSFLLDSNKKNSYTNLIIKNIFISIGFLIPFAIVNAYFFLFTNRFDEFVFATYIFPLNYHKDFNINITLGIIWSFILNYLLPFIFFIFTIFQLYKTQKKLTIIPIIWVIFIFIPIIKTQNNFGHYYLQLVIPLAFFSADSMIKLIMKYKKIKFIQIGTIVFLIIFLLSTINKHINFWLLRKDTPKDISEYLQPKLNNTDYIYTGNYKNIIYYLLDKQPPTKYIHSSLLYNYNHAKTMQININQELQNIKNKSPKYIIIKKKYPIEKFQNFINQQYSIDTVFDNNIYVFIRK